MKKGKTDNQNGESGKNGTGDNERKPKEKKKSWFSRMFRWFILIPLFILAVTICGASAAFVIFAECSKDLPNVEKLKFYSPSETTRIYSSNGELLATLFKENREWVSIEKIPRHLINAAVASEDSRFYEHSGISFKDIARAVVVEVRKGGMTQGASTITQQLAREIFLHPQTSLRRKVREALLAVEIEKKFTKREILELYLNQVYFGSGAYGIQAASKVYFGKDVSKLSVAESALLVGLLPAPSSYSPFVNPKIAKERQILVLKRMNDTGVLSYKAMKTSIDEMLKYAPQKKTFDENTIKYPYFTTYALHELFQRYDDDLLYRGGLKVYTTVDPKMQLIAENAVKQGIAEANAQGLNTHQAAMVAIENQTGFIRAMVGGTGWSDKNQFNRAWQARRQPGSAFKVFVYTAAMDSGYNPESSIQDAPVSYNDGYSTWSPKNADGRFMGAMSMRIAFKLSRNVAAVRILAQLTAEKVIQYAYRMGIKDQLEPNLSIALGSSVVTPLDMTASISVLANEGVRIEPTTIKKIVDSEGNVIEDNTYPSREVVLPAVTASYMTDMMQAVIESGTGTRAQIGRPAAGKTGTTDSYRDAWFVGYTPEMACAVWTGNDNYAQMNQAFGGNIPAGIWASFMKEALKGRKVREFNKPKSDLIQVLICDETGLRATTGCPKTHTEFFRPGKEPRGTCYLHAPKVDASKDKKDDKKETKPAKPEIHEDDLPPPDLSTPKPQQNETIDERSDPPPATIRPVQPPPPDGQVDL